MKSSTLIMIILLSLPVLAFNNGANRTNDNPWFRKYNVDYHNLKSTLRKISRDEWPLPGTSGTAKLKDSSEAVLRIKEYLRATGDLYSVKRSYMSSAVFDKRLQDAVKLFQLRHGLVADGIAGEKTIESMNVPLSERVNQIHANIERLKSFPGQLGERYIIVNIPAFYMEYYASGILKTKMDVVVGEIENYTPVMHDTMTYIVINPEWNVPESITKEEILPRVKEDPEYLKRNNYVLLKGSYTSTDTVPPLKIDWDTLNAENFPLYVVQMPGKKNPLGRIKFMFPNNLNIYLHDTPSDQLFGLDNRALSHGCIRLEKPFELAEMILEGQMKPEELKEILKSEETTSVKLDNKVVIHITYQTAWVDEKGRLNFRDDIYGLDKQSVSVNNPK